jgi:hypothetical protein
MDIRDVTLSGLELGLGLGLELELELELELAPLLYSKLFSSLVKC